MEIGAVKRDPVRKLLRRYPRVLVIKAALMILKNGQKIEMDNVEKLLDNIIRNGEEGRE